MLRRRGPLLLIAFGVILLAGAAGWAAFAGALAKPGEVVVPEAIAGFRLTQKAVGMEAVAEVTRLHDEKFPLTSGAMAMYGSGEAALWVSGVPASPMAARMVQAMTDKIAEGRSPFTPTGMRRVNERAVYELAGMGQRHFYFQAGSLVVWLAADEWLADTAIDEVVKFYQTPSEEYPHD